MSTEKLKVLVVDDEVALAETMAEALERTGYDVVTAHSGAEAIKLLERDEPSVILTDLKMEGMDGLTLLRKAKQELPDAEVVVITGHGDVQTAVEAMRAGAANYVQKPVGLEELRTMVDKAADRYRLTRTIASSSSKSTRNSASRVSLATARNSSTSSIASRASPPPPRPSSFKARPAPARNSSPRPSTTTARAKPRTSCR